MPTFHWDFLKTDVQKPKTSMICAFIQTTKCVYTMHAIKDWIESNMFVIRKICAENVYSHWHHVIRYTFSKYCDVCASFNSMESLMNTKNHTLCISIACIYTTYYWFKCVCMTTMTFLMAYTSEYGSRKVAPWHRYLTCGNRIKSHFRRANGKFTLPSFYMS